MERNTLMAKCYPRIKDYCREKHGLEFQAKSPKEVQKYPAKTPGDATNPLPTVATCGPQIVYVAPARPRYSGNGSHVRARSPKPPYGHVRAAIFRSLF
ncbi:hypothetical protein EVAR_81831_1 [Eumeta japonica]|uniref:Uncharacterized protein n=1 Tax=Eumeta variegata TaxID=151549 RepID=A0A4C1XUC8_EUMVA|nr:hypothetical protein EVAR_81831_1 [Eumeta japonica]